VHEGRGTTDEEVKVPVLLPFPYAEGLEEEVLAFLGGDAAQGQKDRSVFGDAIAVSDIKGVYVPPVPLRDDAPRHDHRLAPGPAGVRTFEEVGHGTGGNNQKIAVFYTLLLFGEDELKDQGKETMESSSVQGPMCFGQGGSGNKAPQVNVGHVIYHIHMKDAHLPVSPYPEPGKIRSLGYIVVDDACPGGIQPFR